MNLKKVLIAGFLLFGVSSVFSQEIDKRLLKSYQESELRNLLDTNKERYELLVYALDEGLQVLTIIKEKGVAMTGSISLPNEPYNFADLGLKITEVDQYYSIEGTEKVLTVKSFSLLNRLKNGK
jgi:hypothetical protein